jgi:hypothetical protein
MLVGICFNVLIITKCLLIAALRELTLPCLLIAEFLCQICDGRRIPHVDNPCKYLGMVIYRMKSVFSMPVIKVLSSLLLAGTSLTIAKMDTPPLQDGVLLQPKMHM